MITRTQLKITKLKRAIGATALPEIPSNVVAPIISYWFCVYKVSLLETLNGHKGQSETFIVLANVAQDCMQDAISKIQLRF